MQSHQLTDTLKEVKVVVEMELELEVVSTPPCPRPRTLHTTLTMRSLWVTGDVRPPAV